MLSRGFSPFKKNVCIIWELVKLLLSVSWEDTLLCDKQRVAIYKRAPNSTSLMTASYKYQTNLPDHPAWLKISNVLKLKRHWLANMKFAEHLGKLLFTIILKSQCTKLPNPRGGVHYIRCNFWGGEGVILLHKGFCPEGVYPLLAPPFVYCDWYWLLVLLRRQGKYWYWYWYC